MIRRDPWRELLRVLLLYLPALVFLAAHYGAQRGNADAIGTGFVQYDQAYYMANARQYVDGANNGFRYASAFSAEVDPPAIYFQPQVFVLGQLWRATGADPGILFSIFGIVFGLLCVRACLRVLDLVLTPVSKGRGLSSLLFVWGGGLFVLLGMAYGSLHGEDPLTALRGAFRFDPAGGWWFLNLGRNLIYPFEAYYHFLFFSIVLAILKKRYYTVVAIATLLAISHPFTGVATLLMLVAWAVCEQWILRTRQLPRWFGTTLAGTLLLTLGYYGAVLPRDPEHAALMAQWKIAWTEDLITTVAAYSVVGLLALVQLRSLDRVRAFLRDPFHRLLLVWGATWFTLENHDLFFTPVQPLHFTHGYTWSALFLIAAPVLARILERERLSSKVSSLVIASFVLVFLLDNGLWMATRTRANLIGEGESITITRHQRELYRWLASELPPNVLIVCNDPMIAYLALVYTPHRAYCSHKFNTPYVAARRASVTDYFNGRITDPLLKQELFAIVKENDPPFLFATQGERLFSSGNLVVYRIPEQP